jgi:hypothetical protein
MSDEHPYCRSLDPHPAVIEVLDGEVCRLTLPEAGSLASAILTCILANDFVTPSEVGCKADMPRFLAAAYELVNAGFPIAFQPGKRVRWSWSWRVGFHYIDEAGEHPHLIDGDKLLRLKPLREWAIARCGAASV